MIRFKYVDLANNGRFTHLLKDIKYFNKNNFYLTENDDEADILYITTDIRNEYKNFSNNTKKYLFDFKKPIIILERADSGTCFFREFDELPNLVGVFKNRIIRDNQKNNIPLFKGRYHYNYVKDDYFNNKSILKYFSYKSNHYEKLDLYKFKNLSDENFKKVKAVIWDKHSSYLDDIVQSHNKYFEETFENKYNDIFCVNRIFERRGYFYYPRPYEHIIHRRKTQKTLKLLKNKYKIITSTSSKSNYLNHLRHSKIIIGCWGYGEWVHLDGSAMMLGGILIKPESDYILKQPDIYQSYKTYVPVNRDMSNLDEVLNEVLQNYNKYKQMRIDNFKLIQKFDVEKTIKYFIDQSKDSIKNFYQKS